MHRRTHEPSDVGREAGGGQKTSSDGTPVPLSPAEQSRVQYQHTLRKRRDATEALFVDVATLPLNSWYYLSVAILPHCCRTRDPLDPPLHPALVALKRLPLFSWRSETTSVPPSPSLSAFLPSRSQRGRSTADRGDGGYNISSFSRVLQC